MNDNADNQPEYDFDYDELHGEVVINNDPENGDYIIRWDNGYPVKVWL